MLYGLLCMLACAPVYWLAVPARHRRDALTAASVAGLCLYDLRLGALVLAVTAGVFGLTRALRGAPPARARALLATGLGVLVALFVWNKRVAHGGGLLPTQGSLAFVGLSYLVLKAAAILVESARGTFGEVGYRELLGWIVFLPTYPAGPIEEFDHFRAEDPVFDRASVLAGCERILFGLVKAVVLSHYLAVWAQGIVANPTAGGRVWLLLALYAFALRFYLDFAGYSDIAIGLAAVFGFGIQENFDQPLLRRNLVQLWQRWHMTLTRWLRLYVFLPVSRALLRRRIGGERGAVIAAQLVTMTACGLWHEFNLSFALWGLMQALGLVWVGVVARDLGHRLPPALVAWWRRSPLAYGLSTACTFTAFSLSLVFVVADVGGAFHLLRVLAGV